MEPAEGVIPAEDCLRSDLSVDRDSFSIALSPDPLVAYLGLRYCSNVECKLKVHYFCREEVDPGTNLKTFRTSIGPIAQPIEIYLPPAHHEPIPEASIPIPFDALEDLIPCTESEAIIPMLIEISPIDGFNAQAEISYLSFTHERDLWKPKLQKQLFFLRNRYFLLHELYGAPREREERVECVVCMSEKRTVVVLPCRHVCICAHCAKVMSRKKGGKCPICRALVESFMQLGV